MEVILETVSPFENAKTWGTERVDFAAQAKSKEDWARWKKTKYEFAFEWGNCWTHCIEYKVADFQAEVGFFIDVLGCDCNSISEDYAMFMGPKREFFFSVRKPKAGETPTPSDALTIEFMIRDLFKTLERLKQRGVAVSEEPRPMQEGSTLYSASFLTPNGMQVRLWSEEKVT